jgi:hypothetical protein
MKTQYSPNVDGCPSDVSWIIMKKELADALYIIAREFLSADKTKSPQEISQELMKKNVSVEKYKPADFHSQK